MKQKIFVDHSPEKMSELIQRLRSPTAQERYKARIALIQIGQPAVTLLSQLLVEANQNIRWQAVDLLGEIASPTCAKDLTALLEDPVFEIRWRAAEGLIHMGREGLIPLFKALVAKFFSPVLRENAHHVLHGLNATGSLDDLSLKVLYALEGVEPELEVAWAAERALQFLS